MVPFRAQEKLVSHSDWSLLGVLFKISDEHPCPFHIRVPPGVRCSPQLKTRMSPRIQLNGGGHTGVKCEKICAILDFIA